MSTGAGPVTPAAVRIADDIAAIGLVTTRNWDGTANPNLDATTNRQGIAADANGWIWVHIELNRTVRNATTLWQPAIDAIAAANLPLLAYDRPSPGGRGHFPKPIGAANTTGTSRYFAREDHTHRGAASTHQHPARVVRFAPVSLTDDSTITIDAARGDYFRVELRDNRTLGVPTNGTDGQRILIEALASGGQRTLALSSSILLTTGINLPITVPLDKRWFGSMIYVEATGWVIIASTVQA